MMNRKRISMLRDGFINGHKKVVYWMQGAQRVEDNHALIRAIDYANHHQMDLVVVFNVVPNYPEANERHYTFMLEGINEVIQRCVDHHIPFKVTFGPVVDNVLKETEDAQALMMDQAYLNITKRWRQTLVSKLPQSIHVEEIDTDLIVPVKHASQKVEYGAYTIRKKLHTQLESCLDLIPLPDYHGSYVAHTIDPLNIEAIIEEYGVSKRVKKTTHFKGGYTEAQRRLKRFIEVKANDYPDRNEPGKHITSTLSPYIHFGQLSTQRIILACKDALLKGIIHEAAYDAIVEQVFVRRELAFNYTYYNPGYDQFETMTEPWAYQTMKDHEHDPRAYVYSKEQLELAQTHDPYWNAAMQEMVKSGYMHNYMRMYWAKKIIEWTTDVKSAYEITTYLNNTYFLDGRDPNSYAGIAWNYGKHDRAWTERPIFGKLRYMNDKGLERKFDMQVYIDYVERLS